VDWETYPISFVTGQHVLTNKPNVVIILDVYAFVHFQIFLVSPWSGQSFFLTSYLLSPPICSVNRPLRGMGSVPLIIEC